VGTPQLRCWTVAATGHSGSRLLFLNSLNFSNSCLLLLVGGE